MSRPIVVDMAQVVARKRADVEWLEARIDELDQRIAAPRSPEALDIARRERDESMAVLNAKVRWLDRFEYYSEIAAASARDPS